MRSLIGKVIEIKGNSLKEIPDNGSDSPVVVFTQTKDFSVTKQRRATFNIMNPRKVIFMGSAGGDDPTTRAERREQELEERRRRGPLGKIAGGAAGSRMFTGGRGGRGGRGGGDDDSSSIFSSIAKFIANNKIVSGILGLGLLSRIPIIGPLITGLARGVFKLGFGATKGGGPSRAKKVFDSATKKRTLPGSKKPTTATDRSGRLRDKKTGRFVKADDVTSKTRLGKFLTSGSKLARFARLGLAGTTFGLSFLAEYLIFESAAQLDKLTERMEENNRALNAMPGDRKEKFQKEHSGMSVHEYHKLQMQLFSRDYPALLRGLNDSRATKGLDAISEAEYVQSLQPEVKYALPHKGSNLTFSGSFADMVDQHAEAAAGPDAFQIIDHKKQQRINIEARQQKIGRPQQQPGFYQSTVDILGIGPKADVTNFKDDILVPVTRRNSGIDLPTASTDEMYENQLMLHKQNPAEYSHPGQKPSNQQTQTIILPSPTAGQQTPNNSGMLDVPDFGGGMLSSRDPNAKELRDIAIGNNHVPNDFVIA